MKIVAILTLAQTDVKTPFMIELMYVYFGFSIGTSMHDYWMKSLH